MANGLAILRRARRDGFLLASGCDVIVESEVAGRRTDDLHLVRADLDILLRAWQLGRCRDFLLKQEYVGSGEVDAFVAMLCERIADPDHEKIAHLMHSHYELVNDPTAMLQQASREVLQVLRVDDRDKLGDVIFRDMLTLTSASWMVVAEAFGDRRTARRLDEMSE